MNADKHGSLPKEKMKNGKGATYPSNHPAQRGYSCPLPVPEIPPSHPFIKGGLGGISEIAFPYPELLDRF
jgi:hypothetical protein